MASPALGVGLTCPSAPLFESLWPHPSAEAPGTTSFQLVAPAPQKLLWSIHRLVAHQHPELAHVWLDPRNPPRPLQPRTQSQACNHLLSGTHTATTQLQGTGRVIFRPPWSPLAEEPDGRQGQLEASASGNVDVFRLNVTAGKVRAQQRPDGQSLYVGTAVSRAPRRT